MQDNATMQEATGFTFRTILDFFGVGDITGIEILFAALALVGGVLFIVYFFLVMIGGFAEGAIEGVFDVDVDMLGADASFQALTFQGIVTFAMIFGLVGLGISQESESAMLAVLGGTARWILDVHRGSLAHDHALLATGGNGPSRTIDRCGGNRVQSHLPWQDGEGAGDLPRVTANRERRS